MQVAEAAKKANQVLGQILRAFTYRDPVNFVRLYTQRVRCYLEYAVAFWNPWLQQDIDTLEDVQRRAVRNICGLSGTYEEKLKKVGLTTLKERRIRGDMIQTFKMINKIDDIDPTKFFSMSRETFSHTTRQAATVNADGTITHSLAINPQSSIRDPRRNFFSNRIVNDWNALPSYVTEATTVNSFKNQYDIHKSLDCDPPS